MGGRTIVAAAAAAEGDRGREGGREEDEFLVFQEVSRSSRT
jgi:hypothetical protein